MAVGDKHSVVMDWEKGIAEGVATLDADGILAEEQRPSATDMGAADLLLSNLSDPAAALRNIGAAGLEQTMQGSVPYGKELAESWEELQARIKAGNFTGIHIGDYKTITLTTGETVIMEVAGIDQYYKCGDTAIGHHVDFISRDCLAGAKQMNSTATNNGTEAEPNPWRSSDLFQALNNEADGVITTLPPDLLPCIIEKRTVLEKRYNTADPSTPLTESTDWVWGNMGKLWLPAEVEVYGCPHWSQSGYGTGGFVQYPIFAGGFKHIIKGNGNGGASCAWWEASACSGSAAFFCYASSLANKHFPTNAYVRAPLCFRIG